MELKDLMENVKEELTDLKEGLVKNIVEQELKNFKVGTQNLDNSTIQFIMENTGKSKGGFQVIHDKLMTAVLPECGDDKLVLNDKAPKIVTDILEGNNVYIYGRAGTGKTFLAKQIAKQILGRGYKVITCNQWTSPIDIVGGQTIEGYEQGRLIDCWKTGKIIILDELPKLDPNTAGLLNETLAETGEDAKVCKLYYDGKLDFGTKIWQKDAEGNKKAVSGVWGIYDKKNPDRFTFFWIEKYDDNNGVVTMIEEDFNELDESENEKPKRTFKSGGLVLEFPTVSDGKGVAQPKHPKFGCVGTGNTDMKTRSADYGGNNQQDYSLVDRFSGGYYKIDIEDNKEIEKALIYSTVYKVCVELRNRLIAQDADESISLRTMLNFNRIYEAEHLIKLSKDNDFAIKGNYITKDNIKTFKDSVESFIDSLGDKADEYRGALGYEKMIENDQVTDFVDEFTCIHGFNPNDSIAEIEKMSKKEQKEQQGEACEDSEGNRE